MKHLSKLALLAVTLFAGLSASAQNLTLKLSDALYDQENYTFYAYYDGDQSIAEGTYVQIDMSTWHTQVMNIYMNGEVVYTKPSGALYKNNVYHFTAGKNCKILGGYSNMFDWNSNPNIRITMDASVAVTGVTLSPTSGELTAGGAVLELTPTVAPEGATDKTVKWSVEQEGSIVALYTDEACTQAVGTAAIAAAKVYVKPLAAGQATITVTSNDDATKTATCTVTVSPAGYSVTMKEGTEDATSWQGKAGEGEYQALPLEGVAAGTAVTVKYNGTKKVKSVKAKKKQ